MFSTKDSCEIVDKSINVLRSLIGKAAKIDADCDPSLKHLFHQSKLPKSATTIFARSPFTKAVLEKAKTAMEMTDTDITIQNKYLKPEVLDVLFSNYMGIFPLWSGIFLGHLKH